MPGSGIFVITSLVNYVSSTSTLRHCHASRGLMIDNLMKELIVLYMRKKTINILRSPGSSGGHRKA